MSMEPTQSPSEPELEVHSGEDFVHIEDSRPTGDMSLNYSIMNVEKAALLDEAVEEEKYKDSDFVVSGGDVEGGDVDGNGGGGEDGECASETTKVELLQELAKSVVILTCESTGKNGSCDVYLIRTAHVSKESCQAVKAVISILKPEAVFVELCSSRLSILKPQTVKNTTMSGIIESWKQIQNTFGMLYGKGFDFAKSLENLDAVEGSEYERVTVCVVREDNLEKMTMKMYIYGSIRVILISKENGILKSDHLCLISSREMETTTQ